MWFDELGYPWPKHGCFDSESDSYSYYSTTKYGADRTWITHQKVTDAAIRLSNPIIGVVTEVGLTLDQRYRIVVRCGDGKIQGFLASLTANPMDVVGEIVLISSTDSKIVILFLDLDVEFSTEGEQSEEGKKWVPVVGEYCGHAVFGVGQIVLVEQRENSFLVTVRFREGDVKKIMAEYLASKTPDEFDVN